MTQAEQDADLAEAAARLARTSISVDRCRHETVDLTSLWLFETNVVLSIARLRPRPHPQIGCVARLYPPNYEAAYRWEATRMMHGQPTARHTFATLNEALDWIESYEHGRRNAREA